MAATGPKTELAMVGHPKDEIPVPVEALPSQVANPAPNHTTPANDVVRNVAEKATWTVRRRPFTILAAFGLKIHLSALKGLLEKAPPPEIGQTRCVFEAFALSGAATKE